MKTSLQSQSSPLSAKLEEPARICVIDLGTNSFHALVVDVLDDSSFNVIDKLKLPVALGDAGLASAVLTHDAVDRATAALRQIVTLAERRGATETLAYATSAIREAENGEDFVRHVREELGLTIKPIEGALEAHLIYLGVRRAVELDGAALLVDIGGGSTEFIVGTSEEPLFETSKQLGAARLSTKFIASDPISESDLKALRKHLETELGQIVEKCRKHKVVDLVGSSGTMENLGTLAMGKRRGSADQHVFSSEEMLELCGGLIQSKAGGRKKMSGLDERRRDQIVAGAILLEHLLIATEIETVRISPAALREGMVSHWQDEPPLPGDDIILLRARELCLHHGGDIDHAHEVSSVAEKLFDEISPLHDFDTDDLRLLRIAAITHDVGHAISGKRHHKHSRYIIAQTEWPGLSPREVTIVSLIARYHRRAIPKTKHDSFSSLGKKDRRRVRRLAAILRVADKLDRSHIGNVDGIEVQIGNKNVHLTFTSERDPRLELRATRRTREAFKDAFGRALTVHAAWRPNGTDQ